MRLGKTPAFRDRQGHPVLGSIADIRYLRLGGVDQWVMIRGASILNPPLIMLHGGPGLGETGLFRHFNAALETDFTVVYWDQRGAGKSASPRIPIGSLTVERFLADLDELVDASSARLGKTKVTLFGHSWGSVLGILYAARFPEKVAAYVGSGQLGDWPAAEEATYSFALAEARRTGHGRIEKALVAIGPPPHDARRLWTQRMCLQRLEGQFRVRNLLRFARAALGGGESSIFELPGALRAFRATLEAMWTEVSQIDLNQLAPVLRVPVFFFLGRHDHWVMPENSVAYFERLKAPSKELLWFEHSGHEPFMDEPEKFNAAMVQLVRPIAAARSGGRP
jgi:pimeloyl-ACP methyl ester carboxylesterase